MSTIPNRIEFNSIQEFSNYLGDHHISNKVFFSSNIWASNKMSCQRTTNACFF